MMSYHIRHVCWHYKSVCSLLINFYEWVKYPTTTPLQRTNGSPNSPDLNPLDYHVWSAMLQTFHKLQSKPKTILELKMHCSRSERTCHRQRSTKLSTTFANVWMRAFLPMVAFWTYDVNRVVALNMA